MTRISIVANTGKNVQLYVFDCCSCGVVFAVDNTYDQRRRADHKSFYCPNGHAQSYSGPTEAEKTAKAAKERADRLATQLRAQRDQTEAAQREAAEAKAREIRLRWRVGNGVCPCCHRTFPGLAAHVASKHPEFVHMRTVQALVRRGLLEQVEHHRIALTEAGWPLAEQAVSER